VSIARPHEVEMWMAALWASWIERGAVLALNERMAESAELAKRMGLIEGAGKECQVLEVYRMRPWPNRNRNPRFNETVAKAERAFAALWESREKRRLDGVSDAEAAAMQREALSVIPGGKVSAPRRVVSNDLDEELKAVGW